MDNGGQLTFSDDPVLSGINEVYQFIEEGRFSDAVEKCDGLMDIDPDYPGLIEAYRAARFWKNRIDSINRMEEGKKTGDFLMEEWAEFDEYAGTKNMKESMSYKSAMKYVFFMASEYYKKSFMENENTSEKFGLLLNLGDCFLKLGEYRKAIDTLEYARNSYNASARLLAILGESYYHTDDIPKSLLYFREAFFVDPSEIDLSMIKAKPVHDLAAMASAALKGPGDVREWVPVYGFLNDIFYVRRNINRNTLEKIENDIYSLEVNYKKLSGDDLQKSNVKPRLINRYLWLLDYYELQNYSFENLTEIRDRLMALDKELFSNYFKNKKEK